MKGKSLAHFDARVLKYHKGEPTVNEKAYLGDHKPINLQYEPLPSLSETSPSTCSSTTLTERTPQHTPPEHPTSEPNPQKEPPFPSPKTDRETQTEDPTEHVSQHRSRTQSLVRSYAHTTTTASTHHPSGPQPTTKPGKRTRIVTSNICGRTQTADRDTNTTSK